MNYRNLSILLILGTCLANACGGGKPANAGNAASANAPTANAGQITNASQTASSDTTPLEFSIKDLGDKDAAELQTFKGRTLVFKTEGVKNWDDGSLTSGYVSRTVICKGDFSEYKDSIKLFQDDKVVGTIYADFKGVVEKVDDTGSGVNITLKDCVVQKLDK